MDEATPMRSRFEQEGMPMKAWKKSFSLIALMIVLVGAAVAFGGCATSSPSPAPVANILPLELALRVCDSETPNCTEGTNLSMGSLRVLQETHGLYNMPGCITSQE